VLDIASGEGYGSVILATKSKNVVGVDLSSSVISHASEKYAKLANLEFKEGSTSDIPLNDGSIEVVVCFETLEHILQQDLMLSEIKRVLTEEGLLVLSTPEKSNYLADSEYKNRHHVKELSRSDLIELISKYFVHSRYYKQFVTVASNIIPEQSGNGGRIIIDKDDPGFIDKQTYNIVIASDGQIPYVDGFAFHSVSDGRALLMKEQEIYNSRTYRLGALLTAPYRFIRHVFASE